LQTVAFSWWLKGGSNGGLKLNHVTGIERPQTGPENAALQLSQNCR
jgi:hypothetical protein